MKEKLKPFCILLFSLLLTGCQSGNQKTQTGDLPVIDLSKTYPQKEIRLQDIADIEYIALETSDSLLLGQSSRINYISDNYIAINDRSEGIFIFDRQGGIISCFNRRGNGPQEYTQNGSIIFDEKNEEIFVPNPLVRKILVYSINGEYKRTLKYSDEFIAPSLFNFDDETILVYNNDKISSGNVYSELPYKLMSKKDGSIISDINIQLPLRYAIKIVQEIEMGGGQKGLTSLSIFIPPNNNIISDGQDFVIADISSDTIYQLNQNKELTPMLTRNPSVHSLDPQKIWTPLLTTDKFIILFTTNLDLVALEQNRNIPTNYLMYEFETGQTHEVSFVSDGYLTRMFPLGHIVVDVPRNVGATLIQASRLKSFYEEKQLKDGFEKIVESIDEEDNPVVAIYKFK